MGGNARSRDNKIRENNSRISFSRQVFRLSLLVAIAFSGIFIGAASVASHAPAAVYAIRAFDALRQYLTYGFVPPYRLIFASPKNMSSEKFHNSSLGEMTPGFHAIMAFNGDTHAYDVSLYDRAGAIVHEWRVFDKIGVDFGGPDHISAPAGLAIGRDGSIVVTSVLDGVLAKFDWCGLAQWRRNDWHHHQVTLDDDGYLWVWRGDGSPFSQIQDIERIDPKTGLTVEKISLNDDILAEEDKQIALTGMPYGASVGNRDADVFHPNDVEVLSRDLADRFPQFSAGDLLISLRNLDTIAVVDRKTHKIKWSARGPWRHQHDPDFTASGEISLFNNNFGGVGEKIVDRDVSSIMAINPATGAVRIVVGPERFEFYSEQMGAHTWIDDKIVEVVSAYDGRVLDFDVESGNVIFAFNNLFTDTKSAHVAAAEWLPEGYFNKDLAEFDCRSAGRLSKAQ